MSIIGNLLDLLYPPVCASCGARITHHNMFFICGACASKITYIKNPVCGLCGLKESEHGFQGCPGREHGFSLARSACIYAGPAAQAVKMLKYGRCLWLSKTLGRILLEGMKEFPELYEADIIAPVPLSRARQRQRGFNQAELLARTAGRFIQKPVTAGNLVRIRNSVPQTGLSGEPRRRNVSGIFRVKSKNEFEGRKVLLVDDVLTTGSTAGECSKELISAGASEVQVLTLARRTYSKPQ